MKITEALGMFFPDEAEPIYLRSFAPKGLPSHIKSYPQTIETCRAQLQSDKALQQRLKQINETQGIYFVVNAGGNKDSEINRINAIFCEIDDLPIQRQHDIYEYESPWMPSMRVVTRNSVHAYWLLEEPISNEDFLQLQKGLIQYYKSDPSIKNLSRVMRVPYFNYVWYENGYQYQPIFIQHWSYFKYTLAELKEAFPYNDPAKPSFPQVTTGSTLDEVKRELRERVMALPSWKSHGKWGSANGVCHDGKGDTGLRVDLASGAVTCWSECSLERILSAFGLEMPKKRDDWAYGSRKHQSSDLHRWYQERKHQI